MDERIEKLSTPEHCEIFARNALERGHPDLASQARKKAIQLRARNHGVTSSAKVECLQAIYAYENVLTKKNGRTTRATRTWQMIDRHGLLQAVEKAVNRPTQTAGYKALSEMGLQDFAFEAVILKYPGEFSQAAVERSKQRMMEWKTSETHPRPRADAE